jgi:transposase
MKGKRAAPTRCITEEIKRRCKQSKGETVFVYVDEYLTSQICNRCKTKEMSNFSVTGSKRRVRAILKCQSYATAWNRDVNGALNIYDIFVYKSKRNNKGPPPFRRPPKE